MKRVAVFCGSRDGNSPAFTEAANRLGQVIAERGMTLVYGGSQTGLMGAVANAALAGGADVIGVLPHSLADRERAHTNLTELHLVDSLAQRKQLMADHADAFLALPGGFGTLDEVFEMITWTQLGVQRKATGLVNTDGFFDHLMASIYWQVDEGFITQSQLDAIVIAEDPGATLDQLVAADSRMS
ncbi:MAG: TIGR00730 family Rossman fold protein [Pseudomonadota bacterium]